MAHSDADIARLKAEFLALLDDNLSATKALKQLRVSRATIKKWCETDVNFRVAFEGAQEEAIERTFDRLDDALDVFPNPQQAKVYSDNIKWKLAKLKPERFGDQLHLKTTHTIDITERFARALERLASERLRPTRDPDDSADVRTLDNVPFRRLPAADTKTLEASETADLTPRGVAGVAPQAQERDDHVTSPPATPARPQS